MRKKMWFAFLAHRVKSHKQNGNGF